jgi:two-component system response regulator CpxR
MQAILVIGDDDQLCNALSASLTHAGFLVEAACDGATGSDVALSRECRLIVLALLRAGNEGGFDCLRHLRTRVSVPIVMLVRGADELDRILALELGADDCLSDPFNPRELLARIHAVLRRGRDMDGDGQRQLRGRTIVVGDISVDSGCRLVRRGGEIVGLTAAEFGVLEMLMRNAGQVVRREELATKVLGRALLAKDRSIDTHVARLRRKLARRGSGAERIKTIRNIGYLYPLSSARDDSGRG